MRRPDIRNFLMLACLGTSLAGLGSPSVAATPIGAGFHWIGSGDCRVLGGKGGNGAVILESSKDKSKSIFVSGKCPAEIPGYGRYNTVVINSVHVNGHTLVAVRKNGNRFLITYSPWSRGKKTFSNYEFRHVRVGG